jgi:hypothetical protein
MTELNYELAPRPGQSASQRKDELDKARFVAVRNLAYMIYKKPDSTPLMTYQETLEDRDRVKSVILMHEVACGYLTNDLGSVPAGAPAQQMAPMAQAPQMAAPPQVAYPPPTFPPQGAPMAQAPQMAPYAVPATMAPQQMAPATAMQAAAAPSQQAEPSSPAPTGRKRRGAAGGAAATPQGAAVANPVGAPTMMPQAPQQMAPAPNFMPQQAQLPLAPAQQAAAPQMGSHVPMTAAADLGPVMARLEAIGADLGRGLATISTDVEKINQRIAALEQVVGKINLNALHTLVAMHHVYGAQANLTTALTNARVGTLEDFRRYLVQFSGNP